MTFWQRSNDLGKLEVLEVYEYYDRPVLLSLSSPTGSTYLAVLADVGEHEDQWLCVAISRLRLEGVRSGAIDLSVAFSNPEDERIFRFSVPSDPLLPVAFQSNLPAEITDDWLPVPGARIELSTALPSTSRLEGGVVRRAINKLLGRPNTLTLAIRPAEGDDEHIRFAGFINQLDALRDVLRNTERIMFGSDGNVYYRIAKLTQNSPPEITLEAVPYSPRANGFGPAIFESVLERFGELSTVSPEWVPGDMDLPALLAYQAFAPTTKRYVSELVISSGDHAVTIDDEFSEHVRTAIGPDDVSRGEITGSLEVVNLHGKPRFVVFPTLGNYKVTCEFPSDRRKEVVAALDHYVRVTGRLRYKSWMSHPHAVDLDEIAILSEEASLAAIDSLRGSEPAMSDETLATAQNALW